MKDCCQYSGSDYDLIVLGAGSAGFSAAITAAEMDKRVALIGHGTIGGTCVNVGCVPSKTMIRAAEALHASRTASRFPGLGGQAQLESWAALAAAKDDLVAALRQKKYADLLPAYPGIEYFDEGPAKLVAGGVSTPARTITAPKVLIATGSRPVLPPIRGIEDVKPLDSTGLLALETLPESLFFIGGGYIGAELAQMMARMGSKVTIAARSRLLPGAEPEVSEALTRALEAEGVTILQGVDYHSAAVGGGGRGVAITLARGGKTEHHHADRLVVTAGRRANSDAMGLETAGVTLDESGAVRTDEHMRTTRSGVYAAGDVTDRDRFVYMAAHGAKVAAKNAMAAEGDALARYDNSTMPWVVFTDPQVAGVGLSEAAARARGYEVKTSVLPLDQLPRALAARDTRGLIKLVADRQSDRLLGGEIVAPEGSDSIQTLAMALKFEMTTRALGEMVFPYLTTVEGLKLAAQTFDKDVAKLSCCAG